MLIMGMTPAEERAFDFSIRADTATAEAEIAAAKKAAEIGKELVYDAVTGTWEKLSQVKRLSVKDWFDSLSLEDQEKVKNSPTVKKAGGFTKWMASVGSTAIDVAAGWGKLGGHMAAVGGLARVLAGGAIGFTSGPAVASALGIWLGVNLSIQAGDYLFGGKTSWRPIINLPAFPDLGLGSGLRTIAAAVSGALGGGGGGVGAAGESIGAGLSEGLTQIGYGIMIVGGIWVVYKITR